MRYFILWLLTVPTGLIYVYLNYPPVQVNWMYVAIFIVFGFLTLYFPILRKRHADISSTLGDCTCFFNVWTVY